MHIGAGGRFYVQHAFMWLIKKKESIKRILSEKDL